MRSFFTLIGLILLLAGCAQEPLRSPPAHPHRVWLAHRARMETITHFAVSAQGAVRAGRHGGALALHWVLSPQAYQMTGSGPFGRLIFRLRVNGEGARLLTEQGRLAGRNPGHLLKRLTGLTLPVRGLRFWILGIPTRAPVAARHIDRFGLLASLDQAGWSIRYRRYRQTAWGRLPMLMTLTHPKDPHNPVAVHVTLRINRWKAA